MTKIIRTKTRAKGGITKEEKKKFTEHADLWIKRILRTKPIEPDKIIPAIEGLYAVSGLPKPKVIIVPSPLVMAIATSFAGMLLQRKDAATRAATDAATYAATEVATYDATCDVTEAATDDATRAATYAATGAATRAATYAATDAATDAATRDATDAATRAATCDATDDATYTATDNATRAATEVATRAATGAATEAATYEADKSWIQKLALELAQGDAALYKDLLKNCNNWYYAYQGGNMWGQYDSYLTAMRDVLGLDLPIFTKYKFWEEAAIHGGFRTMMPTFCMVSDFPEFIRQHAVTKQPHCEYGPSHRWRDGWELFHLHGIRFEKDMYWKIINQEMSFTEILAITDMDKRMVAMRYCKPYKLFEGTKAELVFAKSEKGNELWKIPESSGIFNQDEYFLHYFCPSSGREYIKGVHPDKAKAFEYNGDALMADSHNFTLEEYLDKNFVSR